MSKVAWLGKGERDLDLDAERSLLLFLEFSLTLSNSALVLVAEREGSDVFVASPLTRSIKIEKIELLILCHYCTQ